MVRTPSASISCSLSTPLDNNHADIWNLFLKSENTQKQYNTVVPEKNAHRLGKAPTTWAAADAICKANNGNLASVQSSSSQRELEALCGGTACWIGGKKLPGETSKWGWSDGSGGSFTAFAFGGDSGVNNPGKTALMINAAGHWEFDFENAQHAFVCEFGKMMQARRRL